MGAGGEGPGSWCTALGVRLYIEHPFILFEFLNNALLPQNLNKNVYSRQKSAFDQFLMA